MPEKGCSKFCAHGLDKNGRQQLTQLIARFFNARDFPGHLQLDKELANRIADALPDIICSREERQK